MYCQTEKWKCFSNSSMLTHASARYIYNFTHTNALKNSDSTRSFGESGIHILFIQHFCCICMTLCGVVWSRINARETERKTKEEEEVEEHRSGQKIEGKSAYMLTHCQELFRSSFGILFNIPFNNNNNKTVNFTKAHTQQRLCVVRRWTEWV